MIRSRTGIAVALIVSTLSMGGAHAQETSLLGVWDVSVSNGDYAQLSIYGAPGAYGAYLYYTDAAHGLTAGEDCSVSVAGDSVEITCTVFDAPVAWQADNLSLTIVSPTRMEGEVISVGRNSVVANLMEDSADTTPADQMPAITW